jgi:hypothetical protein
MKVSILILPQGPTELLEKTRASIAMEEEFEFIEDKGSAQGEWIHTIAAGSMWTPEYYQKVRVHLENKNCDKISGPELPHKDLPFTQYCYRIALGSPLSLGTLFARYFIVGRKFSFCGTEKLNPGHLWERNHSEGRGFYYHPRLIVRSLNPHLLWNPNLYSASFLFLHLLLPLMPAEFLHLAKIYLYMLIGVAGGLAMRSHHFLGLPLIVFFQYFIVLGNGLRYLTKSLFK